MERTNQKPGRRYVQSRRTDKELVSRIHEEVL